MSASIKFYLDEHIPKAVATGLRSRGVDVLTVPETGMIGYPDELQLAYALRESRVFVTKDDDFLRLNAEKVPHAGIVFLQRQRSVGDIVKALSVTAKGFTGAELADRVQYL